MPEETMDTGAQVAALNEALRLQQRSASSSARPPAALGLQQRPALQYALTAGSMIGFEYQGLRQALGGFALADLDDARHLVEKITALGGTPTEETAPLRFREDSREAVAWLIELEGEARAALQAAIGRPAARPPRRPSSIASST